MTDLPDSRPFTPMLIGAWWPAPPIGPAAAVDFWSGHMNVKQREAEEVNNVATWLGEHNSGHTAEDMLTRLALGKNRLLDVAHHCRSKSEANDSVAIVEMPRDTNGQLYKRKLCDRTRTRRRP